MEEKGIQDIMGTMGDGGDGGDDDMKRYGRIWKDMGGYGRI